MAVELLYASFFPFTATNTRLLCHAVRITYRVDDDDDGGG